jgi:phenylacetic acid degradation operon negative regulatory protein
MGFRELEPGFSLRPDNLRGGLAGARAQLVALASGTTTADETTSLGRVFLVRDLDPTSDLEARSLWDAARLVDESRQALAALRESEARIGGLSSEEAMVETFLVGGRVLRQLIRHPLLPAEILDPAPLRALLEAMRHYDRLGRSAWAPFLARHDVPHHTLPLDAREPGGAPGAHPSGHPTNPTAAALR